MKKYLFLAFFLLASCAFTQPSKFYRLQSATDNSVVSNRKISIGVEEVSVPRYVDRPQIVLVDKDTSELTVSEFNRWAEPLTSSITRILADDISLCLPNALVKPQNYSMENFTYTVSVEINKFDSTIDKKATLDAWWTILRNGNAVARGRTTVSGTPTQGYDGVVNKQSKLLNEMAQQIAQKIAKL